MNANPVMKIPAVWIAVVALVFAATVAADVRITGERRVWRTVTLTLDGPESAEDATPNPFRDHRLTVVFTHEDGEGRERVVPGYFAADGNAAETGATAGDQWRVHFIPDRSGTWRYEISFRTGEHVAIEDAPEQGEAVEPDGETGAFDVQPTDGSGEGVRDRGVLRYAGERYLRFAGSGEYFIKGGADSPENFLAYVGFDGTRSVREAGGDRDGEAALAPLHEYEPHVRDWREGDPTWGDGKGKGIIGAINYLASRGVNSIYMLTMNVQGDGRDVWPWTDEEERYRFDCSKLDQWNIVFDHMDREGVMLHAVLTETENESLFEVEEGGDFADSRKLYYRELIARFGHHPAIVWNLGEENGWDDRERETTGPAGKANTDAQRKAFAEYIRELDPYDHPVVVHTLPGRYDEIYTPLLGFEHLEGPSLQIHDMKDVHERTIEWIDRSVEAGRPWFVCLDELGPASTGVKPDADDPDHDDVRAHALWGNLMAGGAGVEWYFGYQFPHNDLNLEDFRSRENMWDQMAHALAFFQEHLPFAEMEHADDLIAEGDGYCMAKRGEVYAVYLPRGGEAELRLDEGRYAVRWYNPRTGGGLREGSVTHVEGAGRRSIGRPPEDADRDWVALLRVEDGG